MDNLVRHHIVELDLCNICKAIAEDPLHTILGCLEVEKVWSDHAWFCQAVSSPPVDFIDLLSRFLQVSPYLMITRLNFSFAWRGVHGIDGIT